MFESNNTVMSILLNIIYDDSNKDNAIPNAYNFFKTDIIAFDTYNYIYKEELERLDELEEKEIKQGMDEITDGKYMHFNSTEEYLKYLNDDN